MDSLIRKYKKDELTLEELQELREQMNLMDNQDLEDNLFDIWLHEDVDVSTVGDERMQRMKNQIDRIISAETKKKSRLTVIFRWIQVAAVILLPISIITALYLYHENATMLAKDMVIETGLSERASITLPDGSLVSLNSKSRLIYFPKDYNKKERKIAFGGEGYFQVKRNVNTPFLINAKGLQVRVLGTTFNLSVRDTERTAELALEEGCVSLLSTKTNKKIILKVNQKAILDYDTGELKIVYDKNLKDISAWRRGDMVFRNTSLTKVLQTIEENYAVSIRIEGIDCLDETFTGSLPINNLNEVLEVIEGSFHLKAVIAGKEILLK